MVSISYIINSSILFNILITMINKVLPFSIFIVVYERGDISLRGVVVVKNGTMNQKIRCFWFKFFDKAVLGKR